EDRDRTGDRLLDTEGPVSLEIEKRDLAVGLDAIDLRAQRAGPGAPREVDVLEELPVLDEPLEFLGRDEPVLPSVLLARPLLARRRGDGQLELRHRLEQDLLQRSFAGTGGASDDNDQRLSGGRGQSTRNAAVPR